MTVAKNPLRVGVSKAAQARELMSFLQYNPQDRGPVADHLRYANVYAPDAPSVIKASELAIRLHGFTAEEIGFSFFTATKEDRMTTTNTDRIATDDRPEPVTNASRKADAIRRRVEKRHDWRVKVWAEAELAILGMNGQLEALGEPPAVPFKPDFADRAMLLEYAK